MVEWILDVGVDVNFNELRRQVAQSIKIRRGFVWHTLKKVHTNHSSTLWQQ